MTEIPYLPDDEATRRIVAETRRGGSWQLIAEGSLRDANIVEFRDIPQDFTHLLVRGVWQSQRTAISSSGLRFQWNGLGSGYDYIFHGYTNAGISEGSVLGSGTAQFGQVPSLTRTDNARVGNFEGYLPYYSHPANVKSWFSRCQYHCGPGLEFGRYNIDGCNHTTGAPVTSMQLFDDGGPTAYGPRTRVQLYGAV